ncbi:hypothetical protein [Pedobacter gandavensis]|uniref:hypothetical protein n=1 Tax=Pedobacter gandavensis TaxID=2679963 RepID=UPI001F365475|nr:hypothetical protein [Pedobacter gandavensis]
MKLNSELIGMVITSNTFGYFVANSSKEFIARSALGDIRSDSLKCTYGFNRLETVRIKSMSVTKLK